MLHQTMMFETMMCETLMSEILMCETLIGHTLEDFDRYFDLFHDMVTTGSVQSAQKLEESKLFVMKGVSEFPMRVKCATLAWHATRSALHSLDGQVSTE